jgi:hypothetical protein
VAILRGPRFARAPQDDVADCCRAADIKLTGSVSERSQQIPQKPHAMHISHDLHAVADVSIQNEIISHREVPNAFGNVVSCHSHLRVTGKHAALIPAALEIDSQGIPKSGKV